MSSKYWCFTWNNPLTKILDMPRGGTYLVWQVEKGESGTIHLQGYVEWKCVKTIVQCHKWLPHAAFFVRRGTAEQASAYCKKEDRLEGPWEIGEISLEKSIQGKRLDLVEFKEHCPVKSRAWMLNHYPVEMCRFWRLYDGLVEGYSPKPVGKRNVILCYGEPGTGKTAFARSLCPAEDMCVIPVSKDMWFDGVQGARVCVLDDFTGAFKLQDVLRLLHEYPERVARKGGFTWWNPDTVVLTSNVHPMEWYDWTGREVQREALGRRFTELLYFGDEKRDLSTLTVVPGCAVEWTHGPTLAECKKKNALAVLMSAAHRDHVEKKRKRGDDGLPQGYIDLRATQEIPVVSVTRSGTCMDPIPIFDSDEE